MLVRNILVFTGVYSLVSVVEGAKMQLMDTPLLATFYPEESYAGFPFKIHGFYDSCYNFHGRVESITLGKITEYCDLFAARECGEDNPISPIRAITDPTPRLYEIDEIGFEKVRSVRCFLDEEMVEEMKGELKR